MIGTPFQQEVLKTLCEMGEVYIVGGAVRDAQLGLPAKDLDAVINCPLTEVESYLTRKNYRPHLMGAKQQTVTLFHGGDRLDISQFSGNLESDALRRDFTINSLYWSVNQNTLVDPLGGLNDIREKRLRSCGKAKERFAEDPVRVLRLVRLAAGIGFEIEKDTWAAAVESLSLLRETAVERVTAELGKILMLEDVERGIRLADELGYWKEYIPELARLQGLVQNKYHAKDAWEHTLHVVRNTPRNMCLRVAGLFHDLGKWETASRECYAWGYIEREGNRFTLGNYRLIGKNVYRWQGMFAQVHGGLLDNYPDTIMVKRVIPAPVRQVGLELVPEGKRQFLSHEKESARLVREILPRFRFSMILEGGGKGERELLYLVANHMAGTLMFMNELRDPNLSLDTIGRKARLFAWDHGWDGRTFDPDRVNHLLDLWRADFFGGKHREPDDEQQLEKIQGEIRKACSDLNKEWQSIQWDSFDEFARKHRITGRDYGHFKDYLRREALVYGREIGDPHSLEREYSIFVDKQKNILND